LSSDSVSWGVSETNSWVGSVSQSWNRDVNGVLVWIEENLIQNWIVFLSGDENIPVQDWDSLQRKKDVYNIPEINDINSDILLQEKILVASWSSSENSSWVSENIGNSWSSSENGYNSGYISYDGEVYQEITSNNDLLNTRLFTSKEFDSEIWLYYYNARYYSPELWRFISRDPIDIADDVNLYAYVGNNPVNFSDPSGLASKQILGKGISWTLVWTTFSWFGVLSIFNNDFYYWDEFLWNSLIWAKEVKYYNWSDYVKSLKNTKDYKNLLEWINENIKKGNKSFTWFWSSSDTLTILTLWHYNYTVNSKVNNWYYDVNIQITDIYDFNKEKEDWSMLNRYLNKMHDANTYWILTPFKTEININEKLPLWD
jgi:RHS repeat-associated protein